MLLTTLKTGLAATLASILCASASFAASAPASDASDPKVVSHVDFSRYSGLWHEVAHAPNFFQNGCVRSTADYRVLSKTQVSVYNVCIKADGSTSDISGIATVTDPKQPAKLKVKFNLFARGDYWIVALDPQYEWAVVSGPGRNSLFILSRPAPMAKGLLTVLLQDLQRKGFDTGSLIFDEY